jgi:hypothetical protein
MMAARVRGVWRGVLGVVAVGLLWLVVGVAPALAAAPWWHVLSNSRPSFLKYSAPRLVAGVDEVQELVVAPDSYVELVVGGKEVGEFESEPFPEHHAVQVSTAANVQAALEGPEFYGAGNVLVTGGNAGGTAPLRIETVGALKEKVVEPLVVGFAETEHSEAKGEVSVTAKVVRAGLAEHFEADGTVVATVVNVGDASTSGEVMIDDQLPAGLKAVGVEGELEVGSAHRSIECKLEAGGLAACGLGAGVVVSPFDLVEVRVGVVVEASASSGELNVVRVLGGGAEPFSVSRAITVSGSPVPFGVERYELSPEEEGGGVDTQAGSHPFQTTFTLGLNQGPQSRNAYNGKTEANPVDLTRDLNDRLPAGLIGNPEPFARCTDAEFLAAVNECPQSSVVGVAVVTINEPDVLGITTFSIPVFNLEPSAGEPARFGFLPLNRETPVYIDTSVRTGEDYGVTGEVHNVPQTAAFLSNVVTLWGTPGAAAHDDARGYSCLESADEQTRYPACVPLGERNPPSFFEMPTSCTGPLQSSVEVDSWENPGAFVDTLAQPLPAMDGCNRLAFAPTLETGVEKTEASTASGFTVNVKIPQEDSSNPKGLGESDVQNAVVTLPEGVTVNPSGADGLEACSEALVGYEPGLSSPPGGLRFTGKLPKPLEPGLDFCPDASKVGSVRLKTPILKNPLVGSAYVAAQNANPFGTLIAMYIVAEEPESGVLVKLAGEVQLNQATGQITATFLNNPQAPAEEVELHLYGGERAALSTPTRCGTYTTTATLSPWSGNPPVQVSSSFQITSGPHGSACPGTLPFTPSLQAGSSSDQAGSFTPFTTTISREDGNQPLKSIQLHLPPGVAGIIKGIPQCSEAQADTGSCPAGSLLGETTASVGVGGAPYTVTGGKVYLTGPYQGAPFGLSIVTPAIAGPYNLGLVIVRAKLEINPRSGQVTVSSDPSGPYAIPTILQGIPLDIKRVNVTINRPSFTFNPTNCDPLSITALLASSEGATAAPSDPFQATDCQNLAFNPKVAVTAAGHATKLDGTSLHFKISYPTTTPGSESWITEAKFDIPKQLPARLETLQRACLATVFETSRTNCPAASKIGTATVHTPVLANPLKGTVYFVSYGGAKFPEAVIVLEGENITIELHGETFISKTTGITSATFRNTPDIPFENIEVNIPTGRYSEFGTNLPNSSYNFCGRKLTMPTLLKAQNGQQTNTNTPITITGCTTNKHKTTKTKHHKTTHGTKKH